MAYSDEDLMVILQNKYIPLMIHLFHNTECNLETNQIMRIYNIYSIIYQISGALELPQPGFI